MQSETFCVILITVCVRSLKGGLMYMGTNLNGDIYIEKLSDLEKLIESDTSYDLVMKRIDELYCYKPVSMKLFQLKCKLLNKNNQSEMVINNYKDYYCVESRMDDNIGLWEQIILAYEKANKNDEAIRHNYMKKRLLNNNEIFEEDKKLLEIKERFIQGEESLENINELENYYYYTFNTLIAYCLSLYKGKKYEIKSENEERYINYPNRGYLKERIEEGCTVTIISEGEDKADYDILVYILQALGASVFYISDIIAIDEEFNLKSSVAVSMENQQEYDACVAIPAIAKYIGEEYAGDNIPFLVDYLSSEKTENDFAIVIASNSMLDKLRTNANIFKRFERLSKMDASYLENKIGFGWSGDYYEYIRLIYGFNTRECVEAKSNVKYSIVVPARNATSTLYYTLKTCIEQDFDGTYEIVLSDNSTEGDKNVYNIYKELDCDKIKYYKTPRDLNLTKSFEFAYLKARGEYIIPIGADDAMLPWALRTIDIAWDQNSKDRNILCWDRGFYAWPGFNGGQQNQLTIPHHYKKSNIEGVIHSSEAYKEAIKNNPDMMYMLPNMYLNSGFKRSYLKKIYDVTGKILDGYSQDIYIGVQNLCIEKDFLYIKYPITIAGMSSSSMGALCSNACNDNKNAEKLNIRNGSEYIYEKIFSSNESLIPSTGVDVCGMFMYIEHLLIKGLLSRDYYRNADELCKVYEKCYTAMSILGDKFMKYVYWGNEATKQRGKEVHNWFLSSILSQTMNKRYYDLDAIEARKKLKTYAEGFDESGGMTIDASRFGVENIYEATQLFKSLLHF